MKMHTQICCWGWFNIVFNHVVLVCYAVDETYLKPFSRASDISRGRGPAKFRYFREITQKYFQTHVGKTCLILILAIRPVLFTPNFQIYLETSSLQRVNNVPKLQGVFR